MSDSELRAAMEAATAYEEFLVPAIFREWPARVVEAARLRPGHRVLDVACGTGVLAREVAARVGPDGSVCGLDCDGGMLAVAAQLAPEIEWRKGMAESLPWPDESFDAVVSQFGLMFFRDRAGALRNMMRVLRSGGSMAVAVWGPLEDAPGYLREMEVVKRIAGEAAAEPLRAPFSLGDCEELASLLSDAGAESVAASTHRGTARFPSIRSMVEADILGWLPLMGVVLPQDQIKQILDEAEEALRPYRVGDGAVAFDMQAHIVSGRKP